MRVALAAICESVRTRPDGRLDLIGVAPDGVAVDTLPWRGELQLALILELAPQDDRADVGMNVSVIRTDDGAVVGSVDPTSARQPREIPASADAPVHVPFHLTLRVAFDQLGMHRVMVRRPDGESIADVAFGVMAAAPSS